MVKMSPGVADMYLCLHTIFSSPWLQGSASGVTFLSLKDDDRVPVPFPHGEVRLHYPHVPQWADWNGAGQFERR